MTAIPPLQVLVVEDDSDTRANLCDILELDNYRIETAGSVADALNRDDWQRFSVILLDRQLPDGSAEELLPRLKQLAPDAAIVIVTGHADVNSTIAALRLGAVDYLLKPINPDEIRMRLGRIAAQKQVEHQLRRQAQIFRSVLDNINDGVIVVDDKGKAILLNPAVKRLLGPLSLGDGLEEWPSSHHTRLPDMTTPYPMHDLPLVRALRGEEVTDAEVFIQTPASLDAHWLSGNARPLYDDRGRRKGAVAIFRDITERKRAEELLRRERDFAEDLIDTAQTIVLVLDLDGRIVRFNKFLEDLAGRSLKDVQGKDWFAAFLLPRDWPQAKEAFKAAISGTPTRGKISPIVTKNGAKIEIAWWDKLLYDAQGAVRALLVIGHDVSELKRSQEKLLQSERLAAIGQMMAGLAHESGNALARSQACLEMMALEVADRPEALDLIARIQKAQDHLQHLYEEVRGYAAPIRLERELWDLSGIWRQAWTNLNMLHQNRDAVLQEEIDGVDLRCQVDHFRMEQVFRNIVENALSACRDPVRIIIACAETEIDGRPAVSVCVRDNGPGLTAEQRQRIFDPFFTTKTKGTGLGMAIAKRIAEAHGGQITATHGPTVGAEIQIVLPREIP